MPAPRWFCPGIIFAGTALNMLAPAIVVTMCTIFLEQEKLVMIEQPQYAIVNGNLPGILRTVVVTTVQQEATLLRFIQ